MGAARIVVASVVLAGGIAGAKLTNSGGGGSPDPGTAHIWVDTDGGTCVDNASPVVYATATACGSLDAANDIADCGDVVLIKGGTYGDQTISGDRTCGSGSWTAGASKGVTMTGGVLFEVAPAESVTTGDLALRADWVELSLGDGTAFTLGSSGASDHNVNANSGNTTNNTILRGVSVKGSLFTNNIAESGLRVNNFAFVDGTLGPWDGTGPGAEPIYLQTCSGCSGDTIASNIYIDGITFHDITIPGTADPHTEVIRIDGGSDGVTVRNSTFTDNIATNTAVIFTTWSIYGGGSGAIRPTNVDIYNNRFDSNMVNGVLFELGGAGACVNFTIRYNTLNGGGVFSGNCTPTNMKIVGNLGAKGSAGCYSGATYLKNVWQHSSNVACGTDLWVNGTAGSTDQLGLGGASGFELQNGSVAEEAGEVTNCPALDFDGESRPNGGTNCDAGADERG
jgi:hypothetical protein